MVKKYLVALLALSLAILLAACGGAPKEGAEPSQGAGVAETPGTAAPQTAVPTQTAELEAANPYLGVWVLESDPETTYEFLESGVLIAYSGGQEAGRGTYDWKNGIASADGITVSIRMDGSSMIMGGEDGLDYVLLPSATGGPGSGNKSEHAGFQENWAGYWYCDGERSNESFYIHSDATFAYSDGDSEEEVVGNILYEDGWFHFVPDDNSLDTPSGIFLDSGILTFEDGGSRFYFEEALFGAYGDERDLDAKDTGNGIRTVYDYDLGLFARYPEELHVAVGLLDDAIVVFDDSFGYAVYRNVTQDYLMHRGSDDEFLASYVEGRLIDDFLALYGGSEVDIEGYETGSISKDTDVAACTVNMYNDEFDADVRSVLYVSTFKDGQKLYVSKTRFGTYGDSSQLELLGQSTGGGARR